MPFWVGAALMLGTATARRWRPTGQKALRLAFVGQSAHQAAGPARYLAELAERFSDEHQVTVFADHVDPALQVKIQHCWVPYLRGSWLLSYLSFALANTIVVGIRRLFGERFDILHSNGWDSPLLADVFTCHFCEGAALELEERGLGRLPDDGWRRRLNSWDYHAYRHLLSWIEGLVVRSRRTIIAVSSQTKEDLVRLYGEVAAAVKVIPNGVDVARFAGPNRARFRSEVRQELGLAETDILLLFVGYDWERKGLPRLLEALSLMRKKAVRLVVVGQGDVAYYRAMAESLGVASGVSFVGRASQVERYYSAADIFALPTLYEPFGLAIVEAMASGLPVVTSRQAGAAEYIEPGVSGLTLDDPADPSEIAAKLGQLITRPKLRKQMGQAAAKAVQGLSWEAVAHLVMDAYDQVVSERSPRTMEQARLTLS